MGCLKDSKPTIAMLVLQFTYAAFTLLVRASLTQGMSPRVFVVYRQAIATLSMAPIAYVSSRFSLSLSCTFFFSLVNIYWPCIIT